jgi:hypothetical protein
VAAIGSAAYREALIQNFLDNICPDLGLPEVFFTDGFETPDL